MSQQRPPTRDDLVPLFVINNFLLTQDQLLKESADRPTLQHFSVFPLEIEENTFICLI